MSGHSYELFHDKIAYFCIYATIYFKFNLIEYFSYNFYELIYLNNWVKFIVSIDLTIYCYESWKNLIKYNSHLDA